MYTESEILNYKQKLKWELGLLLKKKSKVVRLVMIFKVYFNSY